MRRDIFSPPSRSALGSRAQSAVAVETVVNTVVLIWLLGRVRLAGLMVGENFIKIQIKTAR
jgi:hypothetical protein